MGGDDMQVMQWLQVTTDVIISFTQNAFCNIFQISFTAFDSNVIITSHHIYTPCCLCSDTAVKMFKSSTKACEKREQLR